MSTTTIHIGIADDHPLIIDGIRDSLAEVPDMEIILEAPSGEVLLAHPRLSEIDVLLLDIRMQPMDGVKVAELMLKRYKKLPIIMVSSSQEQVLFKSLIQLGIKGYIAKVNCNRKVLTHAIQKVLKGHTYFDPVILAGTVDLLTDTQKQKTVQALTVQHVRIIKMAMKGLTEQEIALRLFTTRSNISKHKHKIQQIMKAQSFQEAITICLELGLVSVEDA